MIFIFAEALRDLFQVLITTNYVLRIKTALKNNELPKNRYRSLIVLNLIP